jgi:hypothetical protein
MALATYVTRALPLYAEIPVLAVVYVGCAFLTGAVRRDDVALLLRRRPRYQ